MRPRHETDRYRALGAGPLAGRAPPGQAADLHQHPRLSGDRTQIRPGGAGHDWLDQDARGPGDKGTFTEFEKSVKIADGSTFPVPSLPGGRAAATCIGAHCLAVWHDGDGLVLAVSVIGVGAPDEQTAVTYLDMLGPQVLRTLAALS